MIRSSTRSGCVDCTVKDLSNARRMHSPAGYWLVEVDVAVADFNVESTVGVAAYPCLVVDWRSLTSKVGQRQQAPALASAAFGPTVEFH